MGNASLPGDPVERTVTVRAANVRLMSPTGSKREWSSAGERHDCTRHGRTDRTGVGRSHECGREHLRTRTPRNEDVFLTVELRARSTGDELRFRTRRVRAGTTLPLDFDTVSVVGEVLEVQ